MAETVCTFTGKLQEQGRIAIPETIRELLQIKRGDFLKVIIEKVR
jgi:AbrB family looped-hinge helix DNA binding protein